MKIDNGTSGSRETSTDKPARVEDRGRESINFFAELKRRNVYKVAVAYAVVGWLLVQVATQVFPLFEIPNWAIRLVVLLIVIGFPIALVIAWAFEFTPEGIKRTEDVDPATEKRGNLTPGFTSSRLEQPFQSRCSYLVAIPLEYASRLDRGGYRFIHPGKIDRGLALRKSE